MKTIKSTVKEQIESKTNWTSLGTMLYVIDYSKFINGLETETQAENNAFVYWETTKGIQFQDKRSKAAYNNNIVILAQK